jgi:hypothetical protein
LLGLVLLGQPVVHHVLTAVDLEAGVGMDDLLLEAAS